MASGSSSAPPESQECHSGGQSAAETRPWPHAAWSGAREPTGGVWQRPVGHRSNRSWEFDCVSSPTTIGENSTSDLCKTNTCSKYASEIKVHCSELIVGELIYVVVCVVKNSRVFLKLWSVKL